MSASCTTDVCIRTADVCIRTTNVCIRLMDDRVEPPLVLASGAFRLDLVAAGSATARNLAEDMAAGISTQVEAGPENEERASKVARAEAELRLDVPFGRKMAEALTHHVFTDCGPQEDFVVPDMADIVVGQHLPVWYGGSAPGRLARCVNVLYRMPRASVALLIVADFLADAELQRAVLDDMLCSGESFKCPLHAYMVADVAQRVVCACDLRGAVHATITGRRGGLLSQLVTPSPYGARLQLDTVRCPFVQHDLPAVRADAAELLRELGRAEVVPDVFVPSAARMARRLFGDVEQAQRGGGDDSFVSPIGSVEAVVDRALATGKYVVLHRLRRSGDAAFCSTYSILARSAIVSRGGDELRLEHFNGVDDDSDDSGWVARDRAGALERMDTTVGDMPWFAYDFVDDDDAAPTLLAGDWADFEDRPDITARVAAACPADVRQFGLDSQMSG
jgi:hypothetical protein